MNPLLETADSEPVIECYVSDKLHLKAEGYRRITSVLKPVLTENWKPSSAVSSSSNKEKSSDKGDFTPLIINGSELFVFRKIDDVELPLHIVKPRGWSKVDHCPCLVSYFDGGWATGALEKSIGLPAWAAGQGMVGIAPNFRTRKRFDTTPEDCIADGRAAMRWIAEHSAELGHDAIKLIAVGASAGGHVARWTAFPSLGPGKEAFAKTKADTAAFLASLCLIQKSE